MPRARAGLWVQPLASALLCALLRVLMITASLCAGGDTGGAVRGCGVGMGGGRARGTGGSLDGVAEPAYPQLRRGAGCRPAAAGLLVGCGVAGANAAASDVGWLPLTD